MQCAGWKGQRGWRAAGWHVAGEKGGKSARGGAGGLGPPGGWPLARLYS